MAEAIRHRWQEMRVLHLPDYDSLPAELPDTDIFIGYSLRAKQLIDGMTPTDRIGIFGTSGQVGLEYTNDKAALEKIRLEDFISRAVLERLTTV